MRSGRGGTTGGVSESLAAGNALNLVKSRSGRGGTSGGGPCEFVRSTRGLL